MHLPYENWKKTGEHTDEGQYQAVTCSPASQEAQRSVEATYDPIDNDMEFAAETGTAGLTAISALLGEHPAVAACIAVLGYAIDKSAPSAESVGDSFSNWTEAVSQTRDALKPGGNPQDRLIDVIDLETYDQMTTAQQQDYYTHCTWTLVQRTPVTSYYWKADHYGGLGYIDQPPATVTQAQPSYYAHKYTYNSDPAGPPITP